MLYDERHSCQKLSQLRSDPGTKTGNKLFLLICNLALDFDSCIIKSVRTSKKFPAQWVYFLVLQCNKE